MEVNFLFSNELVHELEKLIRSSKKYLLLVSPYIDLDDRIRAALKEKIEDPHFKLEVLYGKNRAYPYKSVKKDSFEFLMQFPNIEIKHEEILHAKFYQNESHFIMTSMNLYDYSLANNFEVGVIAKYASTGFVGKISDKTDVVIDLFSKGNNDIERTFYLILATDWISVYLAEEYKVDSIEIKVIDRLKKALSEK